MSEERASSPGASLLRSASLSTLFSKRKRSHLESDDNTSVNDANSSEEDEIAHKKRKTEELEAKKEFQRREKVYDEELPEEYRKFRPTGYRFKIPPKGRPVRIYADGVFDLFHLGHMRQLEQAKKALPNAILICGIPSDVETHKRKGLTVLSDYQRCETLKHCKWVDEVIPDAPWCVTPAFLEKHKIDYVAHDDLPYASSDSDDIYKPIKEKGMFLTTQRTEGISTSDIITKIIRDYDKYLMRNFARGATRQELNVSWFKKNELEFKKHINDFRSYWKKTNENLNNASKDLYFEVREYLLKKSILKNSKNSPSSPASDFAKIYTGDDHRDSRACIEKSPSFIENFKDWMYRTDNDLSDRDTVGTKVSSYDDNSNSSNELEIRAKSQRSKSTPKLKSTKARKAKVPLKAKAEKHVDQDVSSTGDDDADSEYDNKTLISN